MLTVGFIRPIFPPIFRPPFRPILIHIETAADTSVLFTADDQPNHNTKALNILRMYQVPGRWDGIVIRPSAEKHKSVYRGWSRRPSRPESACCMHIAKLVLRYQKRCFGALTPSRLAKFRFQAAFFERITIVPSSVHAHTTLFERSASNAPRDTSHIFIDQVRGMD